MPWSASHLVFLPHPLRYVSGNVKTVGAQLLLAPLMRGTLKSTTLHHEGDRAQQLRALLMSYKLKSTTKSVHSRRLPQASARLTRVENSTRTIDESLQAWRRNTATASAIEELQAQLDEQRRAQENMNEQLAILHQANRALEERVKTLETLQQEAAFSTPTASNDRLEQLDVAERVTLLETRQEEMSARLLPPSAPPRAGGKKKGGHRGAYDERTKALHKASRVFVTRLREAMGTPAPQKLPDFPAPGIAPPKKHGVTLIRFDWSKPHDCQRNVDIMKIIFDNVKLDQAVTAALDASNETAVHEACMNSIQNLYKKQREEKTGVDNTAYLQQQRRWSRAREKADKRQAELLPSNSSAPHSGCFTREQVSEDESDQKVPLAQRKNRPRTLVIPRTPIHTQRV